MPLSASDLREVSDARKVAKLYIEAWFNQDYEKLYLLQSKYTTIGTYDTFRKLSFVYRTEGFAKGFDDGESVVLDRNALNRAVSSIQLVTGVTDQFVRPYLLLSVFGKEAGEAVASGKWPEKVLLFRSTISGKQCAIFMVKEKGHWYVLNQPGQFEQAIPQFWDNVKSQVRARAELQ